VNSEKSAIVGGGVEGALVSDLDRQVLYHFEQSGDDRRLFLAKKQDKQENRFLKKRMSDQSRSTTQNGGLLDDDEGYDDKLYQKEKLWNRQLEPDVVIPKSYNEKMQRDRVHD
jgi:hypothetical protein